MFFQEERRKLCIHGPEQCESTSCLPLGSDCVSRDTDLDDLTSLDLVYKRRVTDTLVSLGTEMLPAENSSGNYPDDTKNYE